jgi:hypothetical protein
MNDDQKIVVAAQLAAALITGNKISLGSYSGTTSQWAVSVFEQVYKALPSGVKLARQA